MRTLSATFYERCLRLGDYANDGGPVELYLLHPMLSLFSAGNLSANDIKSFFNCTGPQSSDVDDLLATMPTSLLTVTLGVSRATWAHRVYSILYLGSEGYFYTTEALAKTELGV